MSSGCQLKIASENPMRPSVGKNLAVIRFSHTYVKMPGGFEHSLLLETLRTHKSELHKCFIEYDSRIEASGGYYPLPDEPLIVILLKADMGGGELWTTIRRYTPRKWNYYRDLRGKIVRCEVQV